jgi:hypothetical protein
MKFHILLMTSILALAACGGASLPNIGGAGDGGGGEGVTPTEETLDFSELTADLGSAIYDPVLETLTITLLPFDGSPIVAEYVRNTALDTAGFDGFSLEENSNARLYYAMFKAGESTFVGTVATDFDFENSFGGTTFDVTVAGNLPTGGIATYLGEYVGLTDATNLPDGPTIINGDALINVDFNDGEIEGKLLADSTLFNDAGALLAYDADLLVARETLLITTLDGNEFLGDISGGGTYGGVIGGDGGELAATFVFDNEFGDKEFGALVAPQTCLSSPETPC